MAHTSPLSPCRCLWLGRFWHRRRRWAGSSGNLGYSPCLLLGSFMDDSPPWFRLRRCVFDHWGWGLLRSFDRLANTLDVRNNEGERTPTGGLHSGWNSPPAPNFDLTAMSSAISLCLHKRNDCRDEISTYYCSCLLSSLSFPISANK